LSIQKPIAHSRPWADDDRQSARHRFEHRQVESVLQGWSDHYVGGGVEDSHVLYGREEFYAIGKAKISCTGAERTLLVLTHDQQSNRQIPAAGTRF